MGGKANVLLYRMAAVTARVRRLAWGDGEVRQERVKGSDMSERLESFNALPASQQAGVL